MGSGIDNRFLSYCKHESENCKTQNLMANSRFGCVENVNAEHPKSLFVFGRIFFGINVKDGEPQVIVNLCVGFLISRAGGPLVIDQVLAGLAV